MSALEAVLEPAPPGRWFRSTHKGGEFTHEFQRWHEVAIYVAPEWAKGRRFSRYERVREEVLSPKALCGAIIFMPRYFAFPTGQMCGGCETTAAERLKRVAMYVEYDLTQRRHATVYVERGTPEAMQADAVATATRRLRERGLAGAFVITGTVPREPEVEERAARRPSSSTPDPH